MLWHLEQDIFSFGEVINIIIFKYDITLDKIRNTDTSELVYPKMVPSDALDKLVLCKSAVRK